MAGSSFHRFAGDCAPRPSSGLAAPLRSAPATEDDANWWMITLSDLTLLLLGFLACWYVVHQTTPPDKVLKENVATAPQAPVEPAVPAPLNAAPSTPLDGAVWQAMQNDLSDFIVQAGLANEVTVESKADEIVLSLKDTVPFASGKADLRARALPILEKIVAVVIAQPSLSVAISGHTDSLRIATTEFPSNWELSAARASRVARHLVERGVHPSRIAVQGFADRRPRRPNVTPLDRSANRRVEIRLFYDSAQDSVTLAPSS